MGPSSFGQQASVGPADGVLHGRPGVQGMRYLKPRPPTDRSSSKVSGQVVTANISDGKQLVQYLAVCQATVLAAQEHKADDARLPDIQRRAAGKG
eukprot:3153802-Pyramimonas_sp.AAC.1